MCIERRHVSRSAFCSAATRPGCNRFTVRSYTRVRARQVHSRAYRHARGIFPFSLSLSHVLSCRSSARFSSLAIPRTSCRTSVSRAIEFFRGPAQPPGWRNVSQRERLRSGFLGGRKIEEKSGLLFSLLHGSSTGRKNDRRNWFQTRTRRDLYAYPRASCARKEKEREYLRRMIKI